MGFTGGCLSFGKEEAMKQNIIKAKIYSLGNIIVHDKMVELREEKTNLIYSMTLDYDRRENVLRRHRVWQRCQKKNC